MADVLGEFHFEEGRELSSEEDTTSILNTQTQEGEHLSGKLVVDKDSSDFVTAEQTELLPPSNRANVSLLCDPCTDEGRSLEVEGYCVDCNDYLCLDCFQSHRKPKPMRHHVVHAKNDMPQAKPITNAKFSNEPKCKVHHDMALRFYCSFHDEVSCETCNLIDHRQCQKRNEVVDINDELLDDEKLNEELSNLLCLFKNMKTKFNKNKDIATQNNENIERTFNQVVNRFTEIRNADLKVTQAVNITCVKMMQEITSITENLDSLTTQEFNTQLFVAMKLAKPKVVSLKSKLIHVGHDNNMFEYVLTEDKVVCYGEFGMLRKILPKFGSIDIEFAGDERYCSITGIEKLSEDTLLVVDTTNQNVKLIDLTSMTVTSSLKLDMVTYDLTMIDDKTVAMTTDSEGKILIISLSDKKMTVKRTIIKKELKNCRGMIYSNNTLKVLCHSNSTSKIQILDISKEIDSLSQNAQYDLLRIAGDFIAHNPDTETLYISDNKNNQIVSMTKDGNKVPSFKHDRLRCPKGITVGRNGRIFVCDCVSNVIFEISADLSTGEIILSENDGILRPISILYDDVESKVYIGSQTLDRIDVFFV